MTHSIAAILAAGLTSVALAAAPASAIAPNGSNGQQAPGFTTSRDQCSRALDKQYEQGTGNSRKGQSIPSNCDHYYQGDPIQFP